MKPVRMYVLIACVYNNNADSEKLNLSNQELEKVLLQSENQTKLPNVNNNKVKFIIFFDMLNIFSNVILSLYLIYNWYLSSPEWLVKFKDNNNINYKDMEFTRSCYISFSLIITMELIYLLCSLLVFIYDIEEIYSFCNIVCYATMIIVAISVGMLLYNNKILEEKKLPEDTKNDFNKKGYMTLAVVILNIVILLSKNYLHKQKYHSLPQNSTNYENYI